MKSEKITLGRVVVAARRRRGMSQRELAMVLETRILLRLALYTSRKSEESAPSFADLSNGFKFDFRHLSKIENDRVDVCDRAFDCFIYCFAEWADISIEWLETIRQQTEAKPLDLAKAIFPPKIYYPR